MAGSPGSAFRNKWLTSYQESMLVIKQDLPFSVTHGPPSAVCIVDAGLWVSRTENCIYFLYKLFSRQCSAKVQKMD